MQNFLIGFRPDSKIKKKVLLEKTFKLYFPVYIMEKEAQAAGTGGYYNSEGKFIEAPKKQFTRLQIAYSLRFGLIWTLFFAILGIAIQSVKAKSLIFVQFFGSNWVDWLASFGTFTDPTVYPTAMDFIYSLLSHWYYFFYTGGLLAILWGLLSWIIHSELIFKRKEKPVQVEPPRKEEPKKEEPVPMPVFNTPPEVKKEAMEEWLAEGYLLLAQGKTREARMIYTQLRRAYNPDEDINHVMYKRLLDFYQEILDEIKHPGLNKEKEEWEG